MELFEKLEFSTVTSNYLLFQIFATLVAFLVFFFVRRLLGKSVLRRSLLHNFDETRTLYISKTFKLSAFILLLVFLGVIWEVSVEGLSVYLASFITIVGVGLFATWSIVSNITSSIILFFFFPLKVGSKVKIMDGDNSAEGIVLGLSLFSIRIEKEDGNEIFYPNNLAIQKSIVHLKDKKPTGKS